MPGQPILTFDEPLQEGVLLKRYKRFLADVELKSGEIITAHCANTGPMTGVLYPGGRVRVRYVPSPTRKLLWSWDQAEVPGENGSYSWVGINTSLSNRIVRSAIEAGCLNDELGSIALIKGEVAYGLNKRSRIDFLLTPKENAPDCRSIYLEVKNTTWTESDLALFPDTVTERGQKHLREMIGVLPEARAILVPCIGRSDVKAFAPGDSADPTYGKLFRLALKSGVEVIPCCFGFHVDCITWEEKRPISQKVRDSHS